MPDLLSSETLPRRPESLRHSHSLSLPIAEEFCSSQWSPLLTPQTATDFDDQQSRLDPDDSSTRPLLRPYSYTDADDTSTRTLLRHRSYSSYEPGHDSADQEGSAEPDFPTEHGAHGLPNDQEASYRLSTLKQPANIDTIKQPVETELWKSRQSASSQCRLAVDDGGWWWHQMLVDRSLRSMAALTTVFALMMVILCFAYFGDFVNRVNKNSTSVGGLSGESCSTMESSNVACFPNTTYGMNPNTDLILCA
ncbi:hypothetical protein MMC17_008685 [Xylographa soralifera]|nr:hypothetical protein [Xylographa soralifera]